MNRQDYKNYYQPSYTLEQASSALVVYTPGRIKVGNSSSLNSNFIFTLPLSMIQDGSGDSP